MVPEICERCGTEIYAETDTGRWKGMVIYEKEEIYRMVRGYGKK